jgi:hypothetical protein
MSALEKEKIYNEILEYYQFAEILLNFVSEDSSINSGKQFEIVQILIENLEQVVEKLSINYIEIIKEGYSSELIQKIRDSLNQISAIIENCQTNILMLYKQD